MTKLRILTASLMALAAVASGGALAASTQSYDELAPAAIIISDRDLNTFLGARDVAERSGAHGLQMYPPDVIFGRFERALDRSLFSDLHVVLAFSAADLSGKGLDAMLEGVVATLFNYREALQSAMAAGGMFADDGMPIDDMVLRVPPDVVRRTTPQGPRCGSPMELEDRGVSQNSEFLIGSVLLNVIFPESHGNIENWTDKEIGDALSAMSLGLAQYQRVALWTDLSFTINRYVKVPVSTEPIHSSMDSDGSWIGEVLANIGYPQGAYYGVHLLNNAMRKQYGTEWAYTAIIADMSNHFSASYTSDSCWAGAGYVAYSYLGGPYMLIPFPACRYGPGLGFGRVFIHEMSHGFWALDEYASAQTLCGSKSGYLAVPTMNTLFQPCMETVPCIMQTSAPPFSEPQPICDYTMGQVGLVDNGNSIPLIYDKPPTIEFVNVDPGVTIYLLPGETDFQIEAFVKNYAVPNKNPLQDASQRMDVAPYIRSCEISIQGAPFVSVAPADGRWDGANEYLMYKPVLDPGLNTIVFKVQNRVYHVAQIETKVYQYGIKYYYIAASPAPGSMQVSWVTPGEVFGAVFDVFRVDQSSNGTEELLASVTEPAEANESRRSYRFVDADIVAGHEYSYKIVARFSIVYNGETYSFAIPSSNIVETALVPLSGFISSPMPNPIVGDEKVTFTVDIPKSFTSVGDEPTSRAAPGPRGAALATETKTPVDIAIYNVLGQRIRTIYANSIFGRFLTRSWDGTDADGKRVQPGVYFVYVQAGDRKDSRKIVILR